MVYYVSKDQLIYDKIAKHLVRWNIVTWDHVRKIARPPSRKRQYWKRHIYDLCTFALNKMERESIHHEGATQLCERGISYYET